MTYSQGFEGGLAGWSAFNANATVTASTTAPASGTGCLLITANGGGTAAAKGELFPAAAGVAQPVTVKYRPEVAQRDVQAYLEFFTANDVFISGSSDSAATNAYASGLPLNAYATLTFTATAPPGTAKARIVVGIQGPAAGDRGRVDDVSVGVPVASAKTVYVRLAGALVAARSSVRFGGTQAPAATLIQGVYRGTSGDGYDPAKGIFAPAGGVSQYQMFQERPVEAVLIFPDGAAGTDGWLNFDIPDYLINPATSYGLPLIVGSGPFPADNAYNMTLRGNRVGHDLVLSGAYDSHLLTHFTRLLAKSPAGAPIYYRLCHEFNINQFPHRGLQGKHAEFVASWRYVVDFARALPGGERILWSWNPSLSSGNAESTYDPATGQNSQINIDLFYPGDDYVDHIGPDFYDQGYPPGGGSGYYGEPGGFTVQQHRDRNWARKKTGTATPTNLETDKTTGINCLNGIDDYAKEGATRNGVPNCEAKARCFPEIGPWFGPNGGGDNGSFVTRAAAHVKAAAAGAPPGSYVAFWEDPNDGGQGVMDPDNGRPGREVPNARAAYLAARPWGGRPGAATTPAAMTPAAPAVAATFVDPISYPDGALPAQLVLRRGSSASISGGAIVASDADPAMLIEFTAATAQTNDYLVESVVQTTGAGDGFVGVSACMGGDANQYTWELDRNGRNATLSRQVNGYVKLAEPQVVPGIGAGGATYPVVIGLRVTRLTSGGVRLRGYFAAGTTTGAPLASPAFDITDDDATLRDRKRGGVNQFFIDGRASSAITEYRLTDLGVAT